MAKDKVMELIEKFINLGVKYGFHIVKTDRSMLYPKQIKYSKHRKGRCCRGCKPIGTQLGFERYGTKSCRAGHLSYRAIEVAHQFVNPRQAATLVVHKLCSPTKFVQWS
ncbi:hypothetical protein CDL12_01024 [Handroanthus impetiginosus]|uniref:Uncharacterized protein n=1 Tax=Handroanthus impetiginosus TaxID=429701 RepID=A0A2G9I8Z2_9LAMI|nr:hypothetical protein CDL12_01024 [Handroanthus impetiginosus]